MDVMSRLVLAFGAARSCDGWMDAKQLVPLVGGDGSAWNDVQKTLAALEVAGYVVRVAQGDTWLYRREEMGCRMAAEILRQEDLPLVLEGAAVGGHDCAWQPGVGAPGTLDAMVGQAKARYQIQLNVDWAIATQRPAKPMLFSGPSGHGKTMVGGLVSRALGVPWVRLSMADAGGDDVQSALRAVAAGGVLFFDEIHAAKNRLLDSLLVALDGGELPFTPIGATTDLGVLKADILRRFGRVVEFAPYGFGEATEIATRQAAAKDLALEPSLPALIARAARCNPAGIGVLVDECVMLEARLGVAPTKADFLEHLERRGTDERGVDELDRRLLYALSEAFGGTAGVHRLATSVSIGDAYALRRLQDLAREGLVRAAGRSGWEVTPSGAQYLRTT
jgi:holliday junction DNA helicase RuvB